MPRMGRIVVLLVLAALAANMQCYARCIASAQPNTPACHASDSCHRHASDQSGQEQHGRHSGCDHQQSELARSQNRSAGTVLLSHAIGEISFIGVVNSLSAGPATFGFIPTAQRGSPPPLSILRI
ncbi:MAG TPA: hypothetical protein VHZ07_07325 [Bryobacteraceae bacterium]|nr:hypothetical protein [Bryobacteraceae bacterium]